MLANFVGIESCHDRKAGAPLFRSAGTRRELRGRSRSRNASWTARPWRLFLVRLRALRARERTDRQLGLALGLLQTLFRSEFGLPLGFLIVPAAVVLFALARFGGLAFGAIDRLAHLADAPGLFCNLSFFLVAQLRI